MIKGQNAVFALLSASPFGAVIDIPRFLSESLGVVEKSVSLTNDVLDIGQGAVDEIKSEKSNYDKVVSEFNSLLDNANIKVSSGLNNIENTVNNYGKKIVENENMSSIPIQGEKMPSMPIQGGGINHNKLLKEYQKQSKLIGGRIIQSQIEFLRPHSKCPKTRHRTCKHRKR
jgi:hypothetical protein